MFVFQLLFICFQTACLSVPLHVQPNSTLNPPSLEVSPLLHTEMLKEVVRRFRELAPRGQDARTQDSPNLGMTLLSISLLTERGCLSVARFCCVFQCELRGPA